MRKAKRKTAFAMLILLCALCALAGCGTIREADAEGMRTEAEENVTTHNASVIATALGQNGVPSHASQDIAEKLTEEGFGMLNDGFMCDEKFGNYQFSGTDGADNDVQFCVSKYGELIWFSRI